MLVLRSTFFCTNWPKVFLHAWGSTKNLLNKKIYMIMYYGVLVDDIALHCCVLFPKGTQVQLLLWP